VPIEHAREEHFTLEPDRDVVSDETAGVQNLKFHISAG